MDRNVSRLRAPAFSLSPPESDAESGCESDVPSSGASSSGHGRDVKAPILSLPEPTRLNSIESDRTIRQSRATKPILKVARENELSEKVERKSNTEDSEERPKGVGSEQQHTAQETVEVKSEDVPRLERPKPTKHISWKSVVSHEYPKKLCASTPSSPHLAPIDSVDSTDSTSGLLSHQKRSGNASAPDLRSLDSHKRSSSAKSFKGFVHGMTKIKLQEDDTLKLRPADRTLRKGEVGGGLKKDRSRSRDRKS